MEQLIELTEQEQHLQTLGFKATLKEIADKYGKRHDNLLRDFRKMIDKVTDENYSLLKFEESIFLTESGKNTQVTNTTYELDLKTTLWFISSFDHNLRLKYMSDTLNDYIAKQEQLLLAKQQEQDRLTLEYKIKEEKLVAEHTKAIQDYEQLIKLSGSKRQLLEYAGYMSVSKLREELHITAPLHELFNELVDQGVVEKVQCQKNKLIPETGYGSSDSLDNPRFTLSEGKHLFAKFLTVDIPPVVKARSFMV